MGIGLMLKKLTLKNLLSFGPEGVELELGPLNVLIGPNASGKSNLIDAIRLLAACSKDVADPIIAGGGMQAWRHKHGDQNGQMSVAAVISPREDEIFLDLQEDVQHEFGIWPYGGEPTIWFESVLETDRKTIFYEGGEKGRLLSFVSGEGRKLYATKELGIDNARSIFSQIQGSPAVGEMKEIRRFYSEVQIFSDLNTSRSSQIRQPQPADARASSLSESGENLALVLNDLDNRPMVSKRIIEELKAVHPRATAIKTRVSYSRVEAYLEEEGLRENIPFTRLSDGTLRWLCLLSVLLHPNPPSLICLEEPELGLHPDMIPRLAELLVEASEKTQLVVTTHSELLVSALSDHPESIVVCEHLGGSTEFRRVNPDHLREYIADYRLGDAWLKGEIGGTRY